MNNSRVNPQSQSENAMPADNPQKGGIAIEIDTLTEEVRQLENGIDTLYGLLRPALVPSSPPPPSNVPTSEIKLQQSDIAIVISNLHERVTEQVGVIVSIIGRLDI